MRSLNLLHSRRGRLSAFCILYISEGIPYGFSSTAMVAFMRMEGLTLEQIGAFVGAIFIPWSFKWLWAPVVDIIKLKRLGGRKAWITGCNAMMSADTPASTCRSMARNTEPSPRQCRLIPVTAACR